MYRNAHVYFILSLLVALVGFYPSYFSKLATASPVHHFHGAMATLWILMLIFQSWLMRNRQVQLHRFIGKLSLIVVPLFLLSGWLIVRDMVGGTDRGFVKAFGTQLSFLDVTSMLYFASAYAMALWHRRSIQLHARYMASTVVLLLPPAIGRLMGNYVPGVDSFVLAVHLAYAIAELVVLALLVDDWRKGVRLAPYPALLVFTAFQHVSFMYSVNWAWWASLCRTIVLL